MILKMSELRCKEVICVSDGRRLGFVCDIEIETSDGCVKTIIVPGPCRFLGLFGRKEDYVIPWPCIKRIGQDIILVDVKPEECCVPKHKLWSI